MNVETLLVATYGVIATFAGLFSVWSALSGRREKSRENSVDTSGPRASERRLLCAAGDLAIVIRCRGFPSAVGRLVRVVERVDEPGYEWLVRSVGSPFDFWPRISDGYLAFCRDLCLRPISPAGTIESAGDGHYSAALSAAPVPLATSA